MILQILNGFCSWKILLLSIFLLPVLWLVYKIVEERLSPLRKIPCPPGALPLVGHLFTLLQHGGFLEMMRSWTEQYSPMFIAHTGYGIGIGRSTKDAIFRGIERDKCHTECCLHKSINMGHQYNANKI